MRLPWVGEAGSATSHSGCYIVAEVYFVSPVAAIQRESIGNAIIRYRPGIFPRQLRSQTSIWGSGGNEGDCWISLPSKEEGLDGY